MTTEETQDEAIGLLYRARPKLNGVYICQLTGKVCLVDVVPIVGNVRVRWLTLSSDTVNMCITPDGTGSDFDPLYFVLNFKLGGTLDELKKFNLSRWKLRLMAARSK